MTSVILQPCANKDSKKHYLDTVLNSVLIEDIRKFLTDDEYTSLTSSYPKGEIKIWGVMRGKGSNVTKWGKVKRGDISLFAANKKVFASTVVTYKTINPALAKELWGEINGSTWEYIYFLSELKKQNISYEKLNSVLEYQPTAAIQGFSVLNEQKSYAVLNEFDLYSETYYPEIKSDKSDFIKELEDLDYTSKTLSRKEQSALRRALFKNNTVAKCSICLQEYPIGFLVAAHIKKRSECSLVEKKDLENIVAAMCKFGCDDLYEKGYIGVRDGVVISLRTNLATKAVNNYLECIVNNRCLSWNDNTESYFSWHVSKHSKSYLP